MPDMCVMVLIDGSVTQFELIRTENSTSLRAPFRTTTTVFCSVFLSSVKDSFFTGS